MTSNFGINNVCFSCLILISERKMEHRVEEYRYRMREAYQEMFRWVQEVHKDEKVFTMAEREERERKAEELIEEERQEKEQKASSAKSVKVRLILNYKISSKSFVMKVPNFGYL